jgi:hypothetical protein
VKLGSEPAVAASRRGGEADRDRGPAALDRIFTALEANGCEPVLTSDGRGIVATCPCCHRARTLIVEISAGGEATQ